MQHDNRIFDKKKEDELNKHRKNFYSNMLLHTKRIKLDEKNGNTIRKSKKICRKNI